MPPAEDMSELPEGATTNGRAWLVGGRYEIPFRKFETFNQCVHVGYEFRRTNNFFNYGIETTVQNVDISKFLIRYEGDKRDSWGLTSFGISLYVSPGGMTPYNHVKYYQQERAGTNSRYAYGQVSVDRISSLPKDFNWNLNVLLQLADRKLLPTEEISLGGATTIRGYKENYIIGDYGFMIKNEIRSCPITFIRKGVDSLQLLTFLDLGFAWEVDHNVISKSTQLLVSVGPGMRYAVKENVDIRFDYGFELKEIHHRFLGSNLKSRAHIIAFLRF